MRTLISFSALVCLMGLSSSHEVGLAARPAPTRAASPHASDEDETPLTFKNVIGIWSCAYPGNYGYRFSFDANYRALVIVYLNNSSVIFKGIYTIEPDSKIRINISDMKNEPRTVGLNVSSGFTRTKSTYFLFSGTIVRKNNRLAMHLKPYAIIIDGNSSEGYFEPFLKLSKN